ncbi:bifunctional NUDIX hydrolase/phosphatase PAP2 family protein [Grimontia sp. AD028]|uniref:bifunctional NUDIX hydrolase/phosphatase PAP2 family protein n=1 Tax=Grimontia sp. AD028 TaxID=1581149 RepID=UPI0009E1A93D|nr:bifunctional NUDIX hydrolase/phosphatase PAP2 family protein [Grimontia sp. AD028]
MTMTRKLLTFFLCFFALSPAFATEQPETIRGAACLVSDDQGRVLVTRDILNNRISIPGGFVDSDNPADAAIRETLEETGIAVEVVKEFARLDRAVLFDCRALSPIAIHNQEDGNAMVASWQAEHFGREVRNVAMMTPSSVDIKEVRFPNQVRMIPTWLETATPSETTHFDDFSHMSAEFNVWNASINQAFQDAIKAMPSIFGGLLTASSAMGSGILFFLLIPIATASGGVKRVSQLMFTTVAVTLIVSFAKLHFAVPRPFYLFPDLQLTGASGFAFPSGHTATAFAVWGLVYLWLKQAGKGYLAIWLIPSVLVALSRVYLGVHYITDVLAGAVIGTLVVSISHALTQRQSKVVSPVLWALIGIVTLPLAAAQIQPTFLYCAAFSLTFAVMLHLTKKQIPAIDSPLGKKGFIWSLLSVAGVAGLIGGVGQVSNSSIEILAATTLGFALLALLLSWLAPKLSR